MFISRNTREICFSIFMLSTCGSTKDVCQYNPIQRATTAASPSNPQHYLPKNEKCTMKIERKYTRDLFFRTQLQTLHRVFLQIKICSQWCRRAVISIRHLVIPNVNYQLNSPHLTGMNNSSSSIVEKFKMSNWVETGECSPSINFFLKGSEWAVIILDTHI